MRLIFFLLLTLPELSFSQVNSAWLVTKIGCDTCEVEKCDTLIYLEKNNYEKCIFSKDTLKCTYNFVRFNSNGKELKECSKTMIDSSKLKRMYFITYEENYHWYIEITETKNYKLRKIFYEKDSLNRIDSTLLKGRKPFVTYSTRYYENRPIESTTMKYKYYINRKLRETILEEGDNRFIRYFSFKGKEKLRKYFQRDANTWQLIEETVIEHQEENHYKETKQNYISNYTETYERYTSKEATPEYTKTIIVSGCRTERIVRVKLY